MCGDSEVEKLCLKLCDGNARRYHNAALSCACANPSPHCGCKSASKPFAWSSSGQQTDGAGVAVVPDG